MLLSSGRSFCRLPLCCGRGDIFFILPVLSHRKRMRPMQNSFWKMCRSYPWCPFRFLRALPQALAFPASCGFSHIRLTVKGIFWLSFRKRNVRTPFLLCRKQQNGVRSENLPKKKPPAAAETRQEGTSQEETRREEIPRKKAPQGKLRQKKKRQTPEKRSCIFPIP